MKTNFLKLSNSLLLCSSLNGMASRPGRLLRAPFKHLSFALDFALASLQLKTQHHPVTLAAGLPLMFEPFCTWDFAGSCYSCLVDLMAERSHGIFVTTSTHHAPLQVCSPCLRARRCNGCCEQLPSRTRRRLAICVPASSSVNKMCPSLRIFCAAVS